jgi:hypothetical protein
MATFTAMHMVIINTQVKFTFTKPHKSEGMFTAGRLAQDHIISKMDEERKKIIVTFCLNPTIH